MLDRATFTTFERAGLYVVQVSGDIDCSNAYRLSSSLQLADASNGDVLIDLEHAIYFDSRTLGTLVFFARRMRAAGRRVLIAISPKKPLTKLCHDFGVFKMMDVYDSVDAALASPPLAAR